MKYFLTFLIPCLFYTAGLTQDTGTWIKRSFGPGEGLLSQTVYAIHQDSLGYLVLGTENGLFKFNGVSFSRPSFSENIKSKRIADIISHGPNDYYIMGELPNAVYHIQNEKVVWEYPISGLSTLKNNVIIIPFSRCLYIRKNSEIFRVYEKPPHENTLVYTGKKIFSFHYTPEQELYLWDGESLIYQFNDIQKTLFEPSQADLIWQYYDRSDGSILIWTQDALLTLKKGILLDSIPNKTPINLYVRQAREVVPGEVWFNHHDAKIFRLVNDSIKQVPGALFENESVTSFYIDKNGSRWLGTTGSGLVKLTKAIIQKVPGSTGFKITSIAQDSGRTLLGTDQGIFQLTDKSMRRLSPKSDFDDKYAFFFNTNYTHELKFDQGTYQIATARTSNRVEDHVATRIFGKPCHILTGSSIGYQRDMLFKGFWGLIKFYSPTDQGFDFSGIQKTRGRTNQWISHSLGQWVITDQELLDVRKGPDQTVQLNTLLDANELGPEVDFQSLSIQNGNWYIATSSGLFVGKYNLKLAKIEALKRISFDNCRDYTYIDEGLAWIATSNGLVKNHQGVLERYGQIDGLTNLGVTCLYYLKDEKNLLIGTENGLFTTLAHVVPNIDAHLKIGQIIFDAPFSIDSNINKVILNHNQNSFRLQVDFISLLNSDQVVLMSQLNDDPIDTTQSHELKFSYLKPGTYNIKIWGETPKGQQTEPKVISVQIKLPIWREPLWIFLCVVFIISVISIIIYRRLVNIRKRELAKRIQQQKMIQLEKKALNLSLNPHFLFNSLNSIQGLIANYKDETLVNYVADFSKLMRKTLENSDKSEIDLQEELNHLSLYVKIEQRRFKGKFDFHLNVQKEVYDLDIALPPMLIQPFVENAIAHGILPLNGHGNIWIDIKLEFDFLSIIIEDDGVGFQDDENTSHNSRGITITSERVKLLNKENSVLVVPRTTDLGIVGTHVLIQLKIDSALV